MSNTYDVVIVGCGVAGMTAAIYLKRAGLNPIIIEKSMPGGQIVDNGNILNYPGFTSISGSDLAMNILEQLRKLDVPIKYEEVLEIKDGKEKKVITSKYEYFCHFVIIATGRNPRALDVDGEKELRTRGISYCAVCDGSLYKDKDVVVIGAGDSAFEGASYLSKFVKSVTILYRNSFKAKDYLVKNVKRLSNVKFVKGKALEFSKDDDKIMVKTDDSSIATDGVFIYIGQVPNASFVSNLNILDDDGYVIVDDTLMSNVDGVYAVGDAIKKNDYQIVIAMGEAARVALEIVRRSEV